MDEKRIAEIQRQYRYDRGSAVYYYLLERIAAVYANALFGKGRK